MIGIVTTNDPRPFIDHGSVVLVPVTLEDGSAAYLGVDHRPAAQLAELVEAELEIPVEYEDWQVLRDQEVR